MGNSIADLFQRLTQGVYIIGVGDEKACNAFTAAWVMQISFDPLLLALSINPNHHSYALLRETRAFSVNVLGKGQLQLAAHFGQPSVADKLAATGWTPGQTGVPLLSEAIAWFECRVVDEGPAGDHILMLGQVIDGKLQDAGAEPLTYRDCGTMDDAAALFPDTFGKP